MTGREKGSTSLAEKADEGLAPAPVEKVRIVLGRSFALALRWGIPGGEINPVQAVPRRRFNNARERYLTAEEAGRLRKSVEASSNPQLKHIVGLLLLTGARVGDTPARSSGSSRPGMRT